MAGSPRTPLLLLAALALALALAVSPAAGQGPRKKGMVGGLMEADVNEKGVQEALSFAISEYNKQSNDAYQSRAVRVVRAFKQVRPVWEGARGPGCRGRGGSAEPRVQRPWAPGQATSLRRRGRAALNAGGRPPRGRGLRGHQPRPPAPPALGRAAPSPLRPRGSRRTRTDFSPWSSPRAFPAPVALRGTGRPSGSALGSGPSLLGPGGLAQDVN